MPANTPFPTLREEYLRKKRNRKLLKYGLFLLLAVLIIGIFGYVAHRPELNISKIVLTGGVLVTQQDIASKSFEYMQGSYLWIFPVSNSLLYPKSQLASYLMENFPRIESIRMHLQDFHTLSIDITERKPVATWCRTVSASDGKMEDGSTTEECYFLDQNSTIFAKAPNFSGDAYFKFYGLVDALDPIGISYIASTSRFAEIVSFIDEVRKLSLDPQYLVANSADDFSLVVGGGGQIFFDTKKPLSDIAGNLEALLRTPALSTSTTHNLPVQYIDLRYGNKLFYKLKNQ